MPMEYIRFLHLERNMHLMFLSAFILCFVFNVTPLSVSEHFYLLPS